MNAIAKTTEAENLPTKATESAAILTMIERMALNPEIDPDRIERFIALKERIDANAAKVDFNNALAEAKAQIGPVLKNRKGHNDKKYADFSAIAKVVDPVVTSLGLSYRFRTEQTDRITVTCIISGHGHSEENSLSGPPDASGSKNAIQAIGSTLTYLQRYTLVQALGLSVAEDDDGKAAGADLAVNDQQREALDNLIEQTGADLDKFLAFFQIQFLAELPSKRFDEARRMLEAKRK